MSFPCLVSPLPDLAPRPLRAVSTVKHVWPTFRAALGTLAFSLELPVGGTGVVFAASVLALTPWPTGSNLVRGQR